MRISYSKLCLLTGIGMMCFSTQSFASNCTSAPDCSSLGYTKTSSDCEGLDTIKCPFDTSKVFCSGEAKKEVAVGSILYGDGTVSDTIVSGKKPIGVVFDGENRLAIALTDVTQNGSAGSAVMTWSSDYCDIPNLDTCSDYNAMMVSCGVDGRVNTDAILAANGGCVGTTYAANAVNAYQTSNCSVSFCQKGKWFLPSYRDLVTIYNSKSKINSTLSLLLSYGASKLKDEYYWSSTEGHSSSVLRVQIGAGLKDFGSKYYSQHYVRPVIKF